MARYSERDVERLLQNAAIVRHRGKIESTINNARHAREVVREFGSLAAYFWRHEPSTETPPRRLTRELLGTMSASPESIVLSKDLKQRGWSFVGPATIYAFMQAVGLVNERVHGCSIRGGGRKSAGAAQAASLGAELQNQDEKNPATRAGSLQLKVFRFSALLATADQAQCKQTRAQERHRRRLGGSTNELLVEAK